MAPLVHVLVRWKVASGRAGGGEAGRSALNQRRGGWVAPSTYGDPCDQVYAGRQDCPPDLEPVPRVRAGWSGSVDRHTFPGIIISLVLPRARSEEVDLEPAREPARESARESAREWLVWVNHQEQRAWRRRAESRTSSGCAASRAASAAKCVTSQSVRQAPRLDFPRPQSVCARPSGTCLLCRTDCPG